MEIKYLWLSQHYKRQNPAEFTGKERHAETGLDYFGARYFSGAQGRFTSPDAPFADQFTANPQSWNLYSYTRNNPLKYVDPDGQSVRVCITGGTCFEVPDRKRAQLVPGMIRGGARPQSTRASGSEAAAE